MIDFACEKIKFSIILPFFSLSSCTEALRKSLISENFLSNKLLRANQVHSECTKCSVISQLKKIRGNSHDIWEVWKKQNPNKWGKAWVWSHAWRNISFLYDITHIPSKFPLYAVGYISFDQNGRRTNFSLDVMEMTPRSELLQIGKWSDQVCTL